MNIRKRLLFLVSFGPVIACAELCRPALLTRGRSANSSDLFSKLTNDGAQGTPLDVTGAGPDYDGHYFLLSRLPNTWPAGGPDTRLSRLTLARLQDIQITGVNILVVKRNGRFIAAAASGDTSFDRAVAKSQFANKGKPALLLTDDASLFTVEHEAQHLLDHTDPQLTKLLEPITSLKAGGEISEEEAVDLHEFIFEQRAYAHMITKMAHYAPGSGDPKLAMFGTNNELVSVTDYIKITTSVVTGYFESSFGLYSFPVSKLLTRLSSKNPSAYERLKVMIESACGRTPELPLDEILHLHFSKGGGEAAIEKAHSDAQEFDAFFKRAEVDQPLKLLVGIGRTSVPRFMSKTPEGAELFSSTLKSSKAEILEDIQDLKTPLRSVAETDDIRGGKRLTVNEAIRIGNLGKVRDIWAGLGFAKEYDAKFASEADYWKSSLSFWDLFQLFKTQH